MAEFEYTRRVVLGKEFLFRRVVGRFSVDDEIDMIQYALVVDTAEKIIHPLVGNIEMSQIMLMPFSTKAAAIHWMVI